MYWELYVFVWKVETVSTFHTKTFNMGQSKPIQKSGSCTSVLGKTSTPVASQAIQNPNISLAFHYFFFYYITLRNKNCI
jgi:hypothetical protein